MAQDNSISCNVGPGFLGCLAILFITLKLCGVIDWGWLWVLAPLWIPPAIVFGVFGLVVVAALIAAIVVLLGCFVWWVWEKIWR